MLLASDCVHCAEVGRLRLECDRRHEGLAPFQVHCLAIPQHPVTRMSLTENQEDVRLKSLALICAESTHQAGRFQSSTAPGVLVST